MARVAAVGRVPAAGRVAIPSVTNLLSSNLALDGGDWQTIAATAISGVDDPFGGRQAFTLREANSGASQHSVLPSAGRLTDVTPLTRGSPMWLGLSAWFRPGSRNFGGFMCDLSTEQITAIWNLTTGAATALSASSGISLTAQESFRVPGTSWWRLVLRAYVQWPQIPNTFNGFFPQFAMSSGGGSLVYAGTFGETVDIFSPQLSCHNHAGPLEDARVTDRMRNLARGRVAP